MLEVRSSIRLNRHLNCFFYGLPGSGKTRLASDFPDPVLVDFDDGDLTLQALGRMVPVLRPKNEDQIRAYIEEPETIIEKVIQPYKDESGKYPFTDYVPKTWVFDTFSTMQDVIMGEGPRGEVDFGDGLVLKKKGATGILALPAQREHASMPEGKDYVVFGARMRKLALTIKQMPYHTILTAHAAPSDQVQTPTKPDKFGRVPATKDGYPIMIGQLKYQIGGLADFFLYLKKQAGIYLIETQQMGTFNARNRIDHLLPDRLPWKNKNGFDLINNPLQKALEQLGGKK